MSCRRRPFPSASPSYPLPPRPACLVGRVSVRPGAISRKKVTAMARGWQLPLVAGVTPPARLHLARRSTKGVNLQRGPAVFPEKNNTADTRL